MAALSRLKRWIGSKLQSVNGFNVLREMVHKNANQGLRRLERQLLEKERLDDLRYHDLLLLLATGGRSCPR